jgi:hypothetical protein
LAEAPEHPGIPVKAGAWGRLRNHAKKRNIEDRKMAWHISVRFFTVQPLYVYGESAKDETNETE